MTDKRPDKPTVTDNRTEDTPQRRYWREQARKRYQENPEKKRKAIYRYRIEHPERYQESRNAAVKRKRRGIQRAYRKAPE